MNLKLTANMGNCTTTKLTQLQIGGGFGKKYGELPTTMMSIVLLVVVSPVFFFFFFFFFGGGGGCVCVVVFWGGVRMLGVNYS